MNTLQNYIIYKFQHLLKLKIKSKVTLELLINIDGQMNLKEKNYSKF